MSAARVHENISPTPWDLASGEAGERVVDAYGEDIAVVVAGQPNGNGALLAAADAMADALEVLLRTVALLAIDGAPVSANDPAVDGARAALRKAGRLP